MIHHGRFEVVVEQELCNTVDDAGITDDGDHCVDRDQTGDETRQQVERADGPGDRGLDKAQVQRQQIRNHDRQYNRYNNDIQRKADVLQLRFSYKEILVVFQCKFARFSILKAHDDRRQNGVGNGQHDHQERRQYQSVPDEHSLSSICFIHNQLPRTQDL